jgi:hypothetical protein
MSEHRAKIMFEHEVDGTIRKWYHVARCLTCKADVCGSSTDEVQINGFARNHLMKHPDHSVIVGRVLHLTWEDEDEADV